MPTQSTGWVIVPTFFVMIEILLKLLDLYVDLYIVRKVSAISNAIYMLFNFKVFHFYFIGNKYLHLLTATRKCQLKIEMENLYGKSGVVLQFQNRRREQWIYVECQ